MKRIKNNTSIEENINEESNNVKTDNNDISTENNEFHDTKTENIINDLKQKGFNELQIDDIFETFKRNSISNRYQMAKEGKYIRILSHHTIDTDFVSNIRKSKKIEENKNNSKYKNSFVIKTENTKKQIVNKNKNKYNCAKLYVNASSEKYRKNLLLNHKDKQEIKYKNNIKIENVRKNVINQIKISSNISNTNRTYSRKINQKMGNYLNKFKLSYRNSINNIEERKKEMLKKYEFDDNYNNYNFKIILDTKNIRNSINNIGYLDIKSIRNNNLRDSHYKSRNEKKEENKNNVSNSINNNNELNKYNIKEIKEDGNNNQFKEIKVNLNMNLNSNINNNINNINSYNEKKYFMRNKRKIYSQRKKELKTIDEINTEKINLNNIYNKSKFEQKLFSNINLLSQKQKDKEKERNILYNNYQNNILVIRKQNTKEEEELAKNNISISIIRQESNNINNNKKNTIPIFESRSTQKNKNFIKIEKVQKSKSLSKINDKDNSINHNHNFVNINLCKDKIKNSSTFYENRGLSIQEKQNLEKSFDSSNGEINDISNDNKEISYEKNNKKNTVTNISRINKTTNNNFNKVINSNIKSKNISFNYVTKKFPNGTYKGYILNDKREKNGVMIFDNGAKYEGQWRNDKKNGKGIFTSSHYYNCENYVGMKYEGEFKDDKFDGYGITMYTNGDKYEGEWKNNKQYGRGVVTYFCGEKYDGEWKEGMFDGIGTFFLKNGERFEGKFKGNKYNGYGKYYYLNGDWLEGIFKNDRPSGKCLLHKADGSIVNVTH